jgi:predicted DNA-binding protein (UPF0251 family)
MWTILPIALDKPGESLYYVMSICSLLGGSVPRPRKARWVGFQPGATFYKPRGVPLRTLEHVTLSLEELEAMRLADYEGLYQEDAAQEMNVSRQTFGRVLQEAHRKVAEALAFGKALMIEGGDFVMVRRDFECLACGNNWMVPWGVPRPSKCPECTSEEVRRITPGQAAIGPRRQCRRGRRGRHS